MSSDRGRKEMAAGTSLFCNAYFHNFHFVLETQGWKVRRQQALHSVS